MAVISFAPLHTQRLSEMVEDRIRGLIISQKLKSGERLPSEKELCRQFGVSVVTIREALRGLEAFGIVEKKRGKDGGIFVSVARTDSVKTILNSYFSSHDFSAAHLREVRIIIEPGVAKLAAARMTAESLQTLRENISYCENFLSSLSTEPSEHAYVEMEERIVEFHRLVAEATGNPVLILTIDYIMDFLLESTRKLGRRLDPAITARTIRAHKRIYQRLQSGDGGGAATAMLAHVGHAGSYLIDKEGTTAQPV